MLSALVSRSRVSAAFALVVFLFRANAATLVVYNSNDSGAGSLRQAIADNMTSGGGNTITFSNVVSGTITLTSGELLISNDVTILGPGPNLLAVSGHNTQRVFNIANASASICR